jgi:DDE superfamily endonuclease
MLLAQRIIEKSSVLSKIQCQFLLLVIKTILCCRSRVNFAAMARVSGWNERTFRRHFSTPIAFMPLHRSVIDTVFPDSALGKRVAVFDPSFIPKSGKHTPGLSKFWNGCAQRAEDGLEVTITAIVELGTHRAQMLALQQTYVPQKPTVTDSEKTTKTNVEAQTEAQSEAEKTLIDEYLRHIKAMEQHVLPSERLLAVDSYFAKKRFIDEVLTLDLQCITKLRSDANMKYYYTGEKREHGRGRQKLYDGKVDWDNPRTDVFVATTLEDGTVLLTAVLYHIGLQRRLRVVIVQSKGKKPSRHCILASTDESLDAIIIFQAYRARFQVEFLIRDGKGFTGLTDAQTRNPNALDTHWNLSMLTLNLARAEHYLGENADKPFSIDSIKTRAFNEHFAKRILSIYGIAPEMINNHPEFHNISNYAVINA